MHHAISYKRFSSPKQSKGDSQRRQTDLADEYCRRHHLILIDTYLDDGLSGFTGGNLSDGSALRALLHAAQTGKFPAGTRLIVESLDRLSRREISSAVRLFLDILDTGLVIITLIDDEQIFTKERVDSDLTALIIAIVYLSRANNESKNRRERSLQVHQAARKKARERKIPITSECPLWLRVEGTGDDRHFVVDKARARVIKRIFELSKSGMGMLEIAASLNHRAVPTFTGKPRWRVGTVCRLLKGRAVTGVFHPYLSVFKDGRRWRLPDPDGPIPDYFPRIISESLYKEGRLSVGARLAHHGNRKIPSYRNLLVRLGHCSVCGGPLHLFNSAGWSYLRCGASTYKECPNRLGFPQRKLESVLFAIGQLTTLIERITSDHVGMHIATDADPQSSLNDVASKVQRIEFTDREDFFARLPALSEDAQSPDEYARDPARRTLIAELRRLIEGVVLHPDRRLTLHMKPDLDGYHVVYMLDGNGILGAQVKAPEGITGLIDRSALIELVRPVRRGADSALDATKQLLWKPCSLDDLMCRIRVVQLSNGDWQAIAADPMQMAGIVGRAEQRLGSGEASEHPRSTNALSRNDKKRRDTDTVMRSRVSFRNPLRAEADR